MSSARRDVAKAMRGRIALRNLSRNTIRAFRSTFRTKSLIPDHRSLITNHSLPFPYGGVGRECGVGRGLGVARGVALGVGVAVGVGVGVGVALGEGVGVGVGVCAPAKG